MTTLLQDDEGEIATVIGQVCEQLLCVHLRHDDNSISPSLFWLKIQNGCWHRFFIESSLYYMRWQEEEELSEHELDDEDFPVVNIGAQYGLLGLQIVKAEMRQVGNPEKQAGCFTLAFANGKTLVHTVNQDKQTLELRIN